VEGDAQQPAACPGDEGRAGWDERYPGERRRGWDERHRAGDFEGQGPNPTLVAGVTGLRPGIALELAAGSGTNAVWLAVQGWRTTAVDWSPVGLANGKAKAEQVGVEVEWLERNLIEWSPPARTYSLVVIVYLHLPPEERRLVYARAAAAVAPGGHLLIVGHDRLNATEGEGGPPDTARLFTADEIGRELTSEDSGLAVERAEVMRRVPPPGRGAIDALLLLRRVPAQATRSLPDLGRRGEGWFLIQLALFALIAVAGAAGPAWSGSIRLAGLALGVVLIAAGGLLSLLGVHDLRENLTPFPRPLPDATLVDTGSYGLVRHPIYGGLIVAAAGWGLATASPLALIGAAVLLVFFDLKSMREETWLADQFEGYAAYRKRTRRLLPWIF
jgi:protein-S-isoprenylcysteine O-methyltransferase Ste14/predicted nicotinamide N-methyase